MKIRNVHFSGHNAAERESQMKINRAIPTDEFYTIR